jgi:trigger factor
MGVQVPPPAHYFKVHTQMTITQEKTSALEALVHVTLTREDYEKKVNESIKKIAKKADIKGFRAGMVPIQVVRKMYGNSILAEELNKELNEQMWKYIQDQELRIIGQPIPSADQPLLDPDINALQDVNFSYQIGLAPEVSLDYIDGAPTFDKIKIEIADAEIDEEIMQMRKRFAIYEYPDAAESNDVLSFTIEELDETGQIKEGGLSTVSSIMTDILKPEHQASFLNLKKQDSLDANVWDIVDRDREGIAKNVLNLADVSKAEGVGNLFRLTLNNITRSKPADLNDDFFGKVYGEDGPKTEAEMRERIRLDIDSFYDGHTDRFLMNDFYTAIMEHIVPPMPEEFLKRWLVAASDNPLTAEEVERDHPTLLKQLRWQLISGKIVKDNNLAVTTEETRANIRVKLIQQFRSYGLGNLGDDFVENFVDKQLADKEAVRKTNEQILEDKVMYFIKSKVTLKDKHMTLEQYKTLNEQAQVAAA